MTTFRYSTAASGRAICLFSDSGYHLGRHLLFGQEGRRQEDLRPNLRDQRRPLGLPRERHPPRRHLHRVCQEEDRHRHGRRLRTQ